MLLKAFILVLRFSQVRISCFTYHSRAVEPYMGPQLGIFSRLLRDKAFQLGPKEQI